MVVLWAAVWWSRASTLHGDEPPRWQLISGNLACEPYTCLPMRVHIVGTVTWIVGRV